MRQLYLLQSKEAPVEPYPGGPPTYGTERGAAPPTYDEATGPPPSYQSLFGEIKDARHGSSSVLDFLKKLILILAGTIGCTIAIGLVMAIPIAMIVIGAEYKNDCPIERKIPIYLIVAGSVGVFRNLISLCQRAKKSDNDEGEEEKKQNPVTSILDCFLFAWFICGNVWIYSNYKDVIHDNMDSQYYCDETLYAFAFWITTATYILIGVMCCCVCCVGVCAAIFSEE